MGGWRTEGGRRAGLWEFPGLLHLLLLKHVRHFCGRRMAHVCRRCRRCRRRNSMHSAGPIGGGGSGGIGGAGGAGIQKQGLTTNTCFVTRVPEAVCGGGGAEAPCDSTGAETA